MAKAKINRLEELHGIVTEYYINLIGQSEELQPGILTAVNVFLKNNNIIADGELNKDPIQSLQSHLSDLIEREEGEA